MKQSLVQGREISRLHQLFGIVMGAIVLSILLEVIVQLLPPHYNAISQAESDLAIGPYGFLMDINFALRGVLYLIFLVAFMKAIPKEGQSRSGLILLGISAIGKLIIAFAVTDLTPRPETIHGIIHTLAALVSFFCGGLGILLLSRALRHVPNVRLSPRFLVGLAIVTLIWSIIVIVTVVVSSKIGVWGLLERIYTLLFSLWIFIVSLGLWQYPSPMNSLQR
ncbi:DUF998 domain-containing protein [Ktedonobacteria bacterium brp13]|nr:DUF998 domain-containing protein [Ktedonobacteria bacterium brp13]